MRQKLVIGTRGSKLALAQAHCAASRISSLDPSYGVEIKTITTAGDRDRHTSLSALGGKGIFIKELESALLTESIDVAVHSFKDITSRIPEGLELHAFFAPESTRDALVTRDNRSLEQLPPGACIGTGSMRRRVLLSRMRPDLRIADIRGNIDTRLEKLDTGLYDGIIISEAGLLRLGLQRRIAYRFDPAVFYPAPGQGVIALEIRSDDDDAARCCRGAGDENQRIVSLAELSLLGNLGFDCRTPMGVHTELTKEVLSMRGFYMHAESGKFIEERISGPASDPHRLGKLFCDRLLAGSR